VETPTLDIPTELKQSVASWKIYHEDGERVYKSEQFEGEHFVPGAVPWFIPEIIDDYNSDQRQDYPRIISENGDRLVRSGYCENIKSVSQAGIEVNASGRDIEGVMDEKQHDLLSIESPIIEDNLEEYNEELQFEDNKLGLNDGTLHQPFSTKACEDVPNNSNSGQSGPIGDKTFESKNHEPSPITLDENHEGHKDLNQSISENKMKYSEDLLPNISEIEDSKDDNEDRVDIGTIRQVLDIEVKDVAMISQKMTDLTVTVEGLSGSQSLTLIPPQVKQTCVFGALAFQSKQIHGRWQLQGKTFNEKPIAAINLCDLD